MLAEPATEDASRWKRKYYASLDDLERKEERWGRIEDVLQQSLSRLSLAAYGVDPTVDGRLDKLREALRQRSDAERISELTELVHQSASRAQDERTRRAAASTPATVLRDLVQPLEIPDRLRRKHHRLVEKLSAAGEDVKVEGLIRDVAKLLNAALEGAAAPGEAGERKGLLGRLLGGAERADGELRDAPPPGVDARSAPAPAPDAPPAPAPAPEAGPGIEAVLDALLREMELPAECAGTREALQARLDKPLPAAEIPDLIAEIAALVSVVRAEIDREREEMHRFLASLTVRLQAIDGFMETTDETRAQAIDASRNLHESVTAEVGEIRVVARDAADLDQLRQFVEGRVDTVQRHMEAYLRDAEDRDRRSADEIGRLAGELESTRSEAGELRDRLEEARAMAMRDGLTGVYNRAALEDRLDSEEARWRRYGEPLSLLMWDIDRFKALNDGFGHLAGDKVLKAVAKLLDRGTRESDFAARYGGEEFVVLLPNTVEADARALAEKLRQGIEGAGFKYRGEAVAVTASCGVTELRAGDTARDALRRADGALYAAKEGGRNRVVVAA